MSVWNIAAAQSGSRPGDVDWNIANHLRFIQQAADRKVDFLLFPELSLTGYELPLMAQLAMSPDDARLQPFSDAAVCTTMTITVGLPLRVAAGLQLSALTFLPDGSRVAYGKRNLYGEEQQVFVAGAAALAFANAPRRIALAVCADISVAQYAADAAHQGSDLYAASVLVSAQGYDNDAGYLQRHATDYAMPVLMANHAWPSGGFACCGRSAMWDATGALVASAGGGEQLLIVRRVENLWQGEVHPLPCEPVQ